MSCFSSPPADPFLLFRHWYQQAEQTLSQANAMALATATDKGHPAVRMVLLKACDARGFVFYTNKESRKGTELQKNPHVALCFYWQELGRQIRIEGTVEQVSDEEADQYFSSRPFLSRIGAWASKQSRPMATRSTLWQNLATTLTRYQFGLKSIPRPEYWCGFRVIPTSMEFWQEGEGRLHTRWCYQRHPETHDWQVTLLYP